MLTHRDHISGVPAFLRIRRGVGKLLDGGRRCSFSHHEEVDDAEEDGADDGNGDVEAVSSGPARVFAVGGDDGAIARNGKPFGGAGGLEGLRGDSLAVDVADGPVAQRLGLRQVAAGDRRQRPAQRNAGDGGRRARCLAADPSGLRGPF